MVRMRLSIDGKPKRWAEMHKVKRDTEWGLFLLLPSESRAQFKAGFGSPSSSAALFHILLQRHNALLLHSSGDISPRYGGDWLGVRRLFEPVSVVHSRDSRGNAETKNK